MSIGEPVLIATGSNVARWTARGLAVLIGVFHLFILVDVINKLQKLPLPFTLA